MVQRYSKKGVVGHLHVLELSKGGRISLLLPAHEAGKFILVPHLTVGHMVADRWSLVLKLIRAVSACSLLYYDRDVSLGVPRLFQFSALYYR